VGNCMRPLVPHAVGTDRPATRSPEKPDSPAGFLESGKAIRVSYSSIPGKVILPLRPISCFRWTTYHRLAPAGQSEFWTLRASLAQS
jgi:hypothetical protein